MKRGGTTRAVVALLATAGSFALASSASAQAPLVDDSAADFSAGVQSNTTVAGDGSVEIRRTTDTQTEEFTEYPSGWTNTPSGSSGSNGQSLIVRGQLTSIWISEPGDRLEFTATYSGAEGQYIGLAEGAASATFAIVGGQLVARTVVGGAEIGRTAAGVNPGVAHVYGIERRGSTINYFVDGAEVAVHGAIPGDVRVAANGVDAPGGPNSVVLDSMRFAYPFVASGIFVSRVFDGGDRFERWRTIAVALRQPPGTSVAIQTRTAPAATGPWSPWQAPGAGGDVVSPDQRYLQYTAELASSERASSPSLERVTVDYLNVGSTGGTGGSNRNAAPRVRLTPKTVRVTSRRKLALRVSCPSGEDSCRTTIQLKSGRSTIARKTTLVSGGKTKRVSLTLSRKGYRTLVRRRSLRVQASAAARDGAGNAATTRTTIKLLAPRR